MANTQYASPDLPPHDRMTIEEFLGYVEERPDGEKWELIEGIAVLSPTPTDFHQFIVGNLITHLINWKTAKGSSWFPLAGVGTRVPVSPRSLPAPDVMVKERPGTGSHVSDEALVLFEVLSPSNKKADRDWRLSVYRSVLNCQHYVTIAQNRAYVLRHDRDNDWKATKLTSLDDVLALPALGEVGISLAEIYRWTDVTMAKPARSRGRQPG
jgi:Uma2 family endonuclease